MKKNITIPFSALIVMAVFFVSSCKKESYLLYEKDFAGIYFDQDSLYYSFGVTPFEIESYTLEVPVHIMGQPVADERIFTIAVVDNKTTAKEGIHYTVPNRLTIPPDSVNGYIPITILRNTLGEADYKIHFQLKENDHFKPVYEKFKEAEIHFNNRVERPSWKDWQGNPTWPSQLGVWNPLTYIKFIELFREIEQKSPITYQAMINDMGPDLKNMQYGWAWDYDYTLTKYCLIPMYTYFVKEHPELGISIPKPSGYVD